MRQPETGGLRFEDGGLEKTDGIVKIKGLGRFSHRLSAFSGMMSIFSRVCLPFLLLLLRGKRLNH